MKYNLRELIRGTKYPYCAGLDQWDEIKENARKAHPVRYWIAEDLFDMIEDVIKYPYAKYKDIRNYLSNRFKTKTHTLQLNTKRHYWNKGSWIEYDDRLLYCVMDSFVRWLGEELVPNHEAWNNKIKGSVDEKIRQVLKEKQEFQDQQENLIKVYQECLEIYDWWINFEQDAWYDTSPWPANCEMMTEKYGCFLSGQREYSEEDEKLGKESLAEHNRLEAANEEEITSYLIRLMKIRKFLWT